MLLFMITAKRKLGHDRIHRLGISPRMSAMRDRMNQVQTPSGTVYSSVGKAGSTAFPVLKVNSPMLLREPRSYGRSSSPRQRCELSVFLR